MPNSKSNDHHILVVEDDPKLARAIERGLSARLSKEFSTTTSLAHSADEALELIKTKSPQVCILDLNLDAKLGSESGLTFLNKLLKENPNTRTLVLTGESREEWGLKALKSGATSFLSKPLNQEHLSYLVKDALNYSSLVAKNKHLAVDSSVPAELRSRSQSMDTVAEKFRLAIKGKLPVLITGETGTGKGLLARLIHSHSKLQGEFVRFQPSFGSADLVESELFGHTKGAFTGADADKTGLLKIADKGTLFIDEVDSLPLQTQVLLLEALQERHFRPLGSNKEISSGFRVISATNSDCEKAIKEGKFREDFFHRLSHVKIHLPSLKERKNDIIELAENFLNIFSGEEKLKAHSFSEGARAKLISHSWPGNIRELKAVVESACLVADISNRGLIEAKDLDFAEQHSSSDKLESSFREQIRSYEFKLVDDALKEHDNNISRAAAALGMERKLLKRILARSSN